jgi:predicted NAD/FAD-dependent oxidoreductase
MNTPMAQASAQIFAYILRDSLGSHAEASAFYLPRIDLGKLLPEAVAAYLLRTNPLHQVMLGQRVRAVQKTATGWHVLGATDQVFDALICAISPHRLADLTLLQADGAVYPAWLTCQTGVKNLTYQPIYTVYLQYPKDFHLSAPMLGLFNGLGQWVFDRGQFAQQAGLLAVVVSAEGAHQALSHAELVQSIALQLTQALGFTLPTLLCWQVIAEKRATFTCTPTLQRPTCDIGLAAFALAGDYVASDYPATLEGAVRSGLQAAELILKNSL